MIKRGFRGLKIIEKRREGGFILSIIKVKRTNFLMKMTN